MDKKMFLTMLLLGVCMAIPYAGVTAQLGVTSVAATRIINIIDTGSTIVTIISLIGVVAGVGALSYGFVVAAKAMIKKVGKKLAIAW